MILGILFLFSYAAIVHSEHYQWEYDYSSTADKKKLIQVAVELIKDASMKTAQISNIRNTHTGYLAFDIGIIMGNIREKYRRMLETYREMRDKNNGRSLFVPNSIWELAPIHYVMAMEQVHTLETDIDKSVHVLEMIQSDDLNPDPRYTKKRDQRNSKKRALRNRQEEIDKFILMAQKEQQLKSSIREQSLLKRLGVTGHTARRRFQQLWPVEDSWHMGTYGDMDIYGH